MMAAKVCLEMGDYKHTQAKQTNIYCISSIIYHAYKV